MEEIKARHPQWNMDVDQEAVEAELQARGLAPPPDDDGGPDCESAVLGAGPGDDGLSAYTTILLGLEGWWPEALDEVNLRGGGHGHRQS